MSSNLIAEAEQLPRDEGSILHKTKMCKFYFLGNCERGSKCTFAHNNDQLASTPDLFKTKLCRTLLESGNCNNPQCPFQHRSNEIRTLNEHFESETMPDSVLDRLRSVLPMGTVPPRRFAPSSHAHMMDHRFSTGLGNLQNIVNQTSQPMEQRLQAALAVLDQSLSALDKAKGVRQESPAMKQYISGQLAVIISFLQSGASQLDTGVVNREVGSKFGDIPVPERHLDQQPTKASYSKFNDMKVPPSVPEDGSGGCQMDVQTTSLSQQPTWEGELPSLGDFSRQDSTISEIESLLPWSRQNSAWSGTSTPGGLPTLASDPSQAGRSQHSTKDSRNRTEELSSQSVVADYTKFAKDLEDVLEKELEMPRSCFRRQVSIGSTCSSVFETSMALGLQCYVKNTFLYVDPLAESTEQPQRKTRSASLPSTRIYEPPTLDDVEGNKHIF